MNYSWCNSRTQIDYSTVGSSFSLIKPTRHYRGKLGLDAYRPDHNDYQNDYGLVIPR